MARFDNIGKAILLLREKQNKSQKVLAAEAGITSAMLSNYETGVKKPSLDSLGKILDALGLHLGKLDDSLDMVNDRQQWAPQPDPVPSAEGRLGGDELRRFLGAEGELPAELERGLAEMVEGFRRVSHHVYQSALGTTKKPR